ncbi:Heme oxygenase [Estrella lausannensis]|uniref:Heme oxygenase n=2 Tax=Estrella lausannensis TaxID=483423 RepID=A0A0H5DPX8_9BACT|nr:Heme oxygenase [Estrella lausannensis]
MASPVSASAFGRTAVDLLPPTTPSPLKIEEEESLATDYTLTLPPSEYLEKQTSMTMDAERIKRKTEEEANNRLWNRLHAGIRDVHERARTNPFLLNLIQGQMTCSKAYVVYLCNLYCLHAALEQAQQTIEDKWGEGFFVYRELFRSKKILADIKVWSVFNETAHLFADKNPESPEFVRNIEPYIQESTLKLARSLKEDALSDLPRTFGCMYALYGTIMSGGQFVKKGVKISFLERLQWQIEEYQEEIKNPSTAQDTSSDSLAYREKEYSLAKTNMIQAALTSSALKEKMAEESVALFSFDKDGFNIPLFKREWHQSLSDLPEKLQLKEEALKLFEAQLIECAGEAIGTVLDTIAALEEKLRKGVI